MKVQALKYQKIYIYIFFLVDHENTSIIVWIGEVLSVLDHVSLKLAPSSNLNINALNEFHGNLKKKTLYCQIIQLNYCQNGQPQIVGLKIKV